MTNPSPSVASGVVYITLKAYLVRLAAHERSKPLAQQRTVPSMEALARMIGVHPVTLSNIANNHVKQLNLVLAGRIITALQQGGFPTTISDILAYGTDAD